MGTVNTAKADDWSQSFDAWLKETLNQTNANSDSRLPLGPTWSTDIVFCPASNYRLHFVSSETGGNVAHLRPISNSNP